MSEVRDDRGLCWCGNHRDSHFEKTGPCLAVGCNDCKRFRDRALPDDPAPLPPRPNHASWCRCYVCKLHLPKP